MKKLLQDNRKNDAGTANEDIIKAAKYTIAAGQAGRYERTTKAIGEYVGKLYGYEMKILILELKETTFQPPDLPDQPTKVQEMAWSKEYDLHLKKRDRYEEDKAKVFTTIYSHCDEPMKNVLESKEAYRKADQQRNVIALLQLIKEAAYDANDRKYPARQAVDALRQLMMIWQGDQEQLTAYYRRFTSLIERVEASYGDIEPIAVAKKDSKYRKDTTKAIARARERMLAYLFVRGANKEYKPLVDGLNDDYTLGDDRYPETIEEAFEILTEYGKRFNNKPKKQKEDRMGMVFTQMSKEEMMKKGLCFKCGKHGHRAADCIPKVKDDEKKIAANMAQIPNEEESRYTFMF